MRAKPHCLGNVLRELLLRQSLGQRVDRREIRQTPLLPRFEGGGGQRISASAPLDLDDSVEAPYRTEREFAFQIILIEKRHLCRVGLVACAEFKYRHPARQSCRARLGGNGQNERRLAAVASRLAERTYIPAVLVGAGDVIYQVS